MHNIKKIKNLHIYYYAILRELSGISEEEIETVAETPGELYEQLSGKYGFPLDIRSIRVSVNDAFSEMDSELSPGDTVIFIPPVSGG